MILPRLNIFSDESMDIELYDLDYGDTPILKMDCNRDTFKVFYVLLKAFVVQYDCGYAHGMLQTENDYESILDDYENIIKQLKDYLDEQ